MSNLNLNATRDDDTSLNSSLNVSMISEDDSESGSQRTHNPVRGRRRLSLQEDREGRRKCSRLVFGSIIGMLIFVCLVNGIRSLEEDYPEDLEALAEHKTKCHYGDNFIKIEPCWDDYTPKIEVDKMRDIYRDEKVGGGHTTGEKLTLRHVEFENPLVELLKDV